MDKLTGFAPPEQVGSLVAPEDARVARAFAYLRWPFDPVLRVAGGNVQ